MLVMTRGVSGDFVVPPSGPCVVFEVDLSSASWACSAGTNPLLVT